MVEKILTISGGCSGKRGKTIYPWMTFRGAWLARLDWVPGEKMKVVADEKQIVITKI